MRYAYFMPTDRWLPVESANHLQISSPTGDAAAIFAWVSGTTLESMELSALNLFANPTVIQRTGITNGSSGISRTTEFKGVWKDTQNSVHGVFVVTASASGGFAQVKIIFANDGIWDASMPSLACLAGNITAKCVAQDPSQC
jgi:hypothetical protein